MGKADKLAFFYNGCEMKISIFDLFSIGIGPSSSHTVGPMRAARRFGLLLQQEKVLPEVNSVLIELYGSLALTGKGHGTDLAVILGLEGDTPEGINPDAIPAKLAAIREQKSLNLMGTRKIAFDERAHLLFHKEDQLPYHPNGMRFSAFDKAGKELLSRVYYSVGGGFVVDEGVARRDENIAEAPEKFPHAFESADRLLQICREKKMSIAEVMMENEKTLRTEEEIKKGILRIWKVMQECVKRGCEQEGILPGGLNLKRRAKSHFDKLMKQKKQGIHTPTEVMEWVSVWALAVNEENAAGGRVVTAPTNGAAGIIPAVLHYYVTFTENPTEEGIFNYFLTSGAIGILYKLGASISAAEMGCMGEVGVACSMAAAGLTEALNGTPAQVENAAEIGMEHNLGLTCDPIKGLVQIPCIERNTMGSVKAINASLLAMQGDGTHFVSLDQVIATMRQTGKDMQSIYKETSLGGLAVNVPEC